MISLILTILNGTDIKIKKITMYDSTRDMALCESHYFQSLYIKYIDDGQIITKYINKSDIHSSELYEFIIKNNIFENFEIPQWFSRKTIDKQIFLLYNGYVV